LSIRTKLFLAVLALAVPTMLLMGTLSYLGSRDALERSIFDHLTSVRADKATQVRNYFRDIETQVRLLAEARMVREALGGFEAGWRVLENRPVDAAQQAAVEDYYAGVFAPRLEAYTEGPVDPAALVPRDPAQLYLQYWYSVNEPHTGDEWNHPEDPGDGSAYTAVHRKYHGQLRNFTRQLRFHDLFLIDARGHVLYTVAKEVDLGTDLLGGPFRDSNLARAFRRVVEGGAGGGIVLEDYAHYAPSLGEPASFMACPVVDGGVLAGVLAIQLPIDEIDRIMTSDRRWRIEGLGESGETYLVGPDFRMRSNSRFVLMDPESYARTAEAAGASAAEVRQIRDFGTTILVQKVRSPAVEAALARGADLRRLAATEHHLSHALNQGREISVAVGLVMERHAMSQKDAFEALRRQARSCRVKLSEVAEQMVAAAETVNAFGCKERAKA